MEDMIRRLVDIDRASTERVAVAKQKKVDIQKNVDKEKQHIYDSFIEEQQQKVAQYKQKLEEQKLEEEQKEQEIFEQKMQKIETTYEQNKTMWLDEIVKRCLQ